MSACPLCEGADVRELAAVHGRTWRDCGTCGLLHVPREQQLSIEDERARYLLHENSPDDAGYVAFLERLVVPLAAVLPPGARGLDFGCGPVPVLAGLLAARGFPCASWDPLFGGDADALEREHDFVTATEVLEHLRDPRATVSHLARLVAPGGWLAVMTQLLVDDASFATWHYVRDPTHVALWRPATMEWTARWLGLEMVPGTISPSRPPETAADPPLGANEMVPGTISPGIALPPGVALMRRP